MPAAKACRQSSVPASVRPPGVPGHLAALRPEPHRPWTVTVRFCPRQEPVPQPATMRGPWRERGSPRVALSGDASGTELQGGTVTSPPPTASFRARLGQRGPYSNCSAIGSGAPVPERLASCRHLRNFLGWRRLEMAARTPLAWSHTAICWPVLGTARAGLPDLRRRGRRHRSSMDRALRTGVAGMADRGVSVRGARNLRCRGGQCP